MADKCPLCGKNLKFVVLTVTQYCCRNCKAPESTFDFVAKLLAERDALRECVEAYADDRSWSYSLCFLRPDTARECLEKLKDAKINNP